MVVSVLILVFSVGLLVYWVRYTSLLLVREADAEAPVAYSLFNFPRVREQLQTGTPDRMLHKALERDYMALTYLISKVPVGAETWLLVWDYRLVRCWYRLSIVAFPAQSPNALREMADVIAALVRTLAQACPGAH